MNQDIAHDQLGPMRCMENPSIGRWYIQYNISEYIDRYGIIRGRPDYFLTRKECMNLMFDLVAGEKLLTRSEMGDEKLATMHVDEQFELGGAL